MITIRTEDPEGQLHEISVDDLKEILASESEAKPVVWVDLNQPNNNEEELILREVFDFHSLAILDCIGERISPNSGDHLPKVEDFERYLFSVINPIEFLSTATPSAETDTVVTQQINVFLGEFFIVTHHYELSHAIARTISACRKNPVNFKRGPDYIYHLILHDIVDQYSPTLDRFDQYVDQLEDAIFSGTGATTLQQILNLKRQVFNIRRITSYQREMVHRLARGEFDLITDNEIAYYRNVFDHLVRASDLAESYRDILTGLLDAYLSMTNNRMNEIMKVLTIISTFFLPLTFIAGLYGMNFKFMPELSWHYGYAFALALMFGTALIMFLFFKRKGWL